MDRAKFAMLASVALAWAGLLTLDRSTDARPMDGVASITNALSAMRMSDDATALAGLVLLVCSKGSACVR
jgi:hypothetical protein